MMGKQGKNGISWSDTTWNPVTGCTPVSAGCEHCYAARYAKRNIGDFRQEYSFEMKRYRDWRPFSDVRTHPERLDLPLHWRRPRRIFVCSMGDLFHEQVPDKFINLVIGTVGLAWMHTFQILTKRAVRLQSFMSRFFPEPPSNLWLLVSIENQKTANERIPLLLDTPAAVRGVSIEPMLEKIQLDELCVQTKGGPEIWNCLDKIEAEEAEPGAPKTVLDWVIVGGESGPGARPLHSDWVRSVRDQALSAGVPFHFKGWGEYAPDLERYCGIDAPKRVGKKAAGRMLDGREWLEFPK